MPHLGLKPARVPGPVEDLDIGGSDRCGYCCAVSTDELSAPANRYWVEFVDPADEQQIIRADLTWLTSDYTCVFGRGCRGIDADRPDAGCCSFGAHFTEPADRENVAEHVALLGPDRWHFHELGTTEGWTIETEPDENGATTTQTRVVEGACIFLNPEGFPAGAGCALHLLALERGRPPMEAKPEVCWQLPFRRQYRHGERADGTPTLEITIGEYDREGWGPGGVDLDWYCSTAPSAHIGAEPLFRSGRDELVELLGAEAYEVLVGHCEEFLRRRMPLHPATVAARQG